MGKTRVVVKKLDSPHQSESFTKFMPLSEQMRQEIAAAVQEIFDSAGGASMLKSSKDVYIKPNAIDAKPYCYTRPELVEAVIRYWFSAGAKNVYLFENSTQGNFTRLVFEITGYKRICRETGAVPIYLDEEETTAFEFRGRPASKDDVNGYAGTTFRMSKTVVEKLVKDRDKNLYISLPKLKTHSMAGVTLGIKNQWAFPMQEDRRKDHNYNLGCKLADVLGYLRPDFTLIEGVEGTVYGHYPVTAFADKCVVAFGVLVAGENVVAVDMVGARIFGLGPDDADHLRIAVERGYGDGVASLGDIDIVGDLSPYTVRYPTDLYDAFPEEVRVIRGAKMLCKEGCRNNPLTLLQVLHYDHGGRGGWTMVMGKGHDEKVIDGIGGRVLVVGHCAIEEVGDRLVKRLGKSRVYFSGDCNNLTATSAAMFHLMKVSPLVYVTIPTLRALKCQLLAKAHGTRSKVPSIFSGIIKTV